jgi:hypothetical protein
MQTAVPFTITHTVKLSELWIRSKAVMAERVRVIDCWLRTLYADTAV